MSNKPDKEAIEPILLKHIIEAQREYLKPDLTDAQRQMNAKWYLINSTPSYRGLINAINELLESFSASQNSELKKENENLKQDAAKMYSSLMDKNFQLQKENEELKQKINELTFDNATYEFNEAEGNRVWPQIEEQIREDERQKRQSTIEEKDKEIERLNGLIDDKRDPWDDLGKNLSETTF